MGMEDQVRSNHSKLEKHSLLPDDFSDENLASEYTDNHVDENLHPALSKSSIRNDCDADYSSDESDADFDENALLDCREAFKHELQLYEDGADPTYRTGVDLMTIRTWADVMAEVETARKKYEGKEEKGIRRKIGNGWRNFISAAPAIKQWLQLLPDSSLYCSVLCGGLTVILEVRNDVRSMLSSKLTFSRRQSGSESLPRTPMTLLIRFHSAWRELNSSCEHITIQSSSIKLHAFTKPL